MGVVHWLEGGSLLGAVRENGTLLEWEDDIDISVLLSDDMTWDQLAAGLAERGARDGYFVDLFEKEGFISISFDAPKRWPFQWERNRLRGEIRADIAIYELAISDGNIVVERRSHKGAMPTTEMVVMACRRRSSCQPRRSHFLMVILLARTNPTLTYECCTATTRRSSIPMSIRGPGMLAQE